MVMASHFSKGGHRLFFFGKKLMEGKKAYGWSYRQNCRRILRILLNQRFLNLDPQIKMDPRKNFKTPAFLAISQRIRSASFGNDSDRSGPAPTEMCQHRPTQTAQNGTGVGVGTFRSVPVATDRCRCRPNSLRDRKKRCKKETSS